MKAGLPPRAPDDMRAPAGRPAMRAPEVTRVETSRQSSDPAGASDLWLLRFLCDSRRRPGRHQGDSPAVGSSATGGSITIWSNAEARARAPADEALVPLTSTQRSRGPARLVARILRPASETAVPRRSRLVRWGRVATTSIPASETFVPERF